MKVNTMLYCICTEASEKTIYGRLRQEVGPLLRRLCEYKGVGILREGIYRVANRLHTVALNMEGKAAPDIGGILKGHRMKISVWLRKWQQEGM
jgi:hypothetical protein